MQSWKVAEGLADTGGTDCVNTTRVITDSLVINHTGWTGGYKRFKQDFHPQFLPHAPHWSMHSASPHGPKPQVLLTSAVMVKISQRATSCMSVLQTTLQCVVSTAGDDPATEWQCCSSDDTTARTRRAGPEGANPCSTCVITICTTCINSPANLCLWANNLTENNVINIDPIIPADCQHAFALCLPSLAILILSRLPHITSVCEADKPSWQMSLPIRTVSRRHTASPRTHWLLPLGPCTRQEAPIRYHVIQDKLWCFWLIGVALLPWASSGTEK